MSATAITGAAERRTPAFVGVDVAKREFQECLLGPAAAAPAAAAGAAAGGDDAAVEHNASFPYDEAGIERFVELLRTRDVQLIVMEASGALQLAAALAEEGFPVAVVNPRQARDFARATGRWPRPTGWTPACWRSSRGSCARRPG